MSGNPDEATSPLEPSTSKMAVSSPILLPTRSSLHNSLKQWATIELDGIQMPAITRSGSVYVPVRWIEAKLLTQFPVKLSLDVKAFTMISHRLSAMEALVLNTVNGVMFNFSMGFALLTENDLVVALGDVSRFYWNVKAASLSTASESLNSQLAHGGSNSTLVATLSQLKQVIEKDLERAKSAALKVGDGKRGTNRRNESVEEKQKCRSDENESPPTKKSKVVEEENDDDSS